MAVVQVSLLALVVGYVLALAVPSVLTYLLLAQRIEARLQEATADDQAEALEWAWVEELPAPEAPTPRPPAPQMAAEAPGLQALRGR